MGGGFQLVRNNASQRDDTPSNRFQHSRGYSTNAQLAIDAAHRIVDRPLRHTKPIGNLLDLVPVSEQPQEVHIPLWLISRLCLLSVPLTMISFPSKF
jgi:hypothetical protein